MIDEMQFGVLQRQFQSHVICGNIKVDGIIMLDCLPSTAMDRIRKRGRPEEASISSEYQEQLRACYMKWFNDPIALQFCGSPFVKLINGDGCLNSIKDRLTAAIDRYIFISYY